MIPACIPWALESVYSSTGAPSGVFPKSCFFTLEFPFLAGACAAHASRTPHIRTPANRRICLMITMVIEECRSVSPPAMPFAPAQSAGIDDHRDNQDEQ